MSQSELLRTVDEAIRLTGVERYRYLALEQPSRARRAEWQAYLAGVVEQGGLPAVPVDYGTPAVRGGGCCGG